MILSTKENVKPEQQPIKDSAADSLQISPAIGNTNVIGGIERNFYCRNRDCLHHKGISKRDNVICSAISPQIVSDKDGLKRCFSYRRRLQKNISI